MGDLRLGVIGGSGLYDIDVIDHLEIVAIDTPFGPPSDSVRVGTIHGKPIAFLPRHGVGHQFSPTDINYRANIYALRHLGVQWLVSVSAVGSMRENVHPGDIVIVDQFIDRTRSRPASFFGPGLVAHVPFADPVCRHLATAIYEATVKAGATAHRGGTYICIEGPQFSTRAESNLYRQWGVDVIGMTNMPEARLAREAGICYATLAMVTDYDCWHEDHDDVSVEDVIATLHRNVDVAKRALVAWIRDFSDSVECAHRNGVKSAILTAEAAIDENMRSQLDLFLQH